MTGDHVGEPLPDEVEIGLASEPGTGRHKRPRITTEPPAGSDPNPAPEPDRGTGTENDARLKADKPPHWG